jgi:hypothetical protein
LKAKKPFSKIAKGLEMSWLPLLESFRTFCWGEIIEKLQNTYKLKELISIPASTMNPI